MNSAIPLDRVLFEAARLVNGSIAKVLKPGTAALAVLLACGLFPTAARASCGNHVRLGMEQSASARYEPDAPEHPPTLPRPHSPCSGQGCSSSSPNEPV